MRNSKTKIILNVYDLAPANNYGHQFGVGAYHTGVEISGVGKPFRIFLKSDYHFKNGRSEDMKVLLQVFLLVSHDKLTV